MSRPLSFRRLCRLVGGVVLALMLVPALLRGGVWVTGTQYASDALLAPPEVYEWYVDEPAFGGMSALLMAPDGKALVAGGDRGVLVTASVARDNSHQITAITDTAVTPIRMLRDRPLTRFRSDLESLTRDPEGGLITGFEGYARIERLPRPGELPLRTHKWDRFKRLYGNQAFEALATLPDGRIIGVIERPGAPSMIYDGTEWQHGPDIPVTDGFVITGADIGPDGCLYLLERRFTVLSGFTFRLMRLSGGPDAWDSTLLYASAPADLGNAEAVSAWTRPDGTLTLSLLTDNGFLPFTPTRMIEFRTTPGTGCVLSL